MCNVLIYIKVGLNLFPINLKALDMYPT